MDLNYTRFIRDTPTVNDIDIAIEFDKKYEGKEWDEQFELKMEEAKRKDVNFRSFIDMIIYPHKEVLLFLKARSRYLSIHENDDILNQIEYKLVYP